MSTRLGEFTIQLNGTTHKVDYQRVDMVRFELTFDKAEFSGMADQFRLGWIAARRAGIGVPETFDAFLDLAPDVDFTGDDDEEAPKESGGEKEPTSTSSPV